MLLVPGLFHKSTTDYSARLLSLELRQLDLPRGSRSDLTWGSGSCGPFTSS